MNMHGKYKIEVEKYFADMMSLFPFARGFLRPPDCLKTVTLNFYRIYETLTEDI